MITMLILLYQYELSYIKNSLDVGALHTYFNTVTKHLLYIKTLISHQFTELIIKDMCIPGSHLGRWCYFKIGEGGGDADKPGQGFHFFSFWDKEVDFFLKFELNILD